MSTVLWKKFVILFIFYMRLLRHFIPRNDNVKNPPIRHSERSAAISFTVISSVARQSYIKKRPERFGSLFLVLG